MGVIVSTPNCRVKIGKLYLCTNMGMQSYRPIHFNVGTNCRWTVSATPRQRTSENHWVWGLTYLRVSLVAWSRGKSLATAGGEAHRDPSVVHQAARSTNEQVTCTVHWNYVYAKTECMLLGVITTFMEL